MHRLLVSVLLAAGVAPVPGLGADLAAGTPPTVRVQIEAGGIPASLTGRPGDPQQGRAVIVDQQLGNCLACHAITALKSEPYHGNFGPRLDGVANRLSEAQLRLRVVDPTKINPNTLMPPFYRVDGLTDVLRQFRGRPILTAAQVEDVVAFLETLK